MPNSIKNVSLEVSSLEHFVNCAIYKNNYLNALERNREKQLTNKKTVALAWQANQKIQSDGFDFSISISFKFWTSYNVLLNRSRSQRKMKGEARRVGLWCRFTNGSLAVLDFKVERVFHMHVTCNLEASQKAFDTQKS